MTDKAYLEGLTRALKIAENIAGNWLSPTGDEIVRALQHEIEKDGTGELQDYTCPNCGRSRNE